MSRWFFVAGMALLAVGCSSAQKERSEQREKLSVSSGYFCEFINGDEYQDIDVQLNLSLAKRCDSNKPYTITNYKNSSDLYGIVYCCTLVKREDTQLPKRHDQILVKPEPPPAPAATAASASAPAAAPKPAAAAKPAASSQKPAAPAAKPPAAPAAEKDGGIAD